MADSVLISNITVTPVDTITEVFTSPDTGLGTVCKAFTATNSGSASVTYKAYIYDASGSLVSAIIPQTIVVRDRFHSGPSIVNQTIPKGGSIRIENSTADGLNFYASGLNQ